MDEPQDRDYDFLGSGTSTMGSYCLHVGRCGRVLEGRRHEPEDQLVDTKIAL